MAEKRKDKKGRVLRTGESQRHDLTYQYRYKNLQKKWQYVYAPTLEELRQKETAIQKDINDGIDYAAGKITVTALLERYISLKQGVRYNTRVEYKTVLNLVKKETFGQRQIKDIKVSDVQLWYIKLHEDGKGYSTLANVRGVLKPAFQMAYNEDIIRKKPIVYPDGFEEDVITWFFMDDGDGKTNTENFVIEVQPKPGEGSRNPYDPNVEWKVVLTDVIRITTDVDLLKEISDELGQYCYEGPVNTTEVLLDADWEFTFSFRAETAEEASREVLTAPVATKGQVYKRYGDGDGEYEYVLEEINVTSVKLNALSATITYEFTGLYPSFEWDNNHVYAVMKDGTEIMLEDNWSRWDGYNVLKARSPIVVDEVDHIRLADGTKLNIQ